MSYCAAGILTGWLDGKFTARSAPPRRLYETVTCQSVYNHTTTNIIRRFVTFAVCQSVPSKFTPKIDFWGTWGQSVTTCFRDNQQPADEPSRLEPQQAANVGLLGWADEPSRLEPQQAANVGLLGWAIPHIYGAKKQIRSKCKLHLGYVTHANFGDDRLRSFGVKFRIFP